MLHVSKCNNLFSVEITWKIKARSNVKLYIHALPAAEDFQSDRTNIVGTFQTTTHSGLSYSIKDCCDSGDSMIVQKTDLITSGDIIPVPWKPPDKNIGPIRFR